MLPSVKPPTSWPRKRLTSLNTRNNSSVRSCLCCSDWRCVLNCSCCVSVSIGSSSSILSCSLAASRSYCLAFCLSANSHSQLRATRLIRQIELVRDVQATLSLGRQTVLQVPLFVQLHVSGAGIRTVRDAPSLSSQRPSASADPHPARPLLLLSPDRLRAPRGRAPSSQSPAQGRASPTYARRPTFSSRSPPTAAMPEPPISPGLVG